MVQGGRSPGVGDLSDHGERGCARCQSPEVSRQPRQRPRDSGYSRGVVRRRGPLILAGRRQSPGWNSVQSRWRQTLTIDGPLPAQSCGLEERQARDVRSADSRRRRARRCGGDRAHSFLKGVDMSGRRLCIVTLPLLVSLAAAGQDRPGSSTAKPQPDAENVKYGPHERNVLDLWLAKSTSRTPLVNFIHGGGFRQGDKSALAAERLKAYLDSGFSVAALNYRLTDKAPAPAAYLDGARALQFLRANAAKWNLDGRRVASTGGS